MRDLDQKYYLCKSGEVKKHAEEHRRTFLRLRAKLWKVVTSFGSDEASICDTMMLIRGIHFKDGTPAGWTKPGRHDRCSHPKRGTLSPEIQAFFTPSGNYFIELHEELKPFGDWLKCPFHYSYTSKDGRCSGRSTIGRIFADSFVYWYDPAGPIMLILPDVAAAKARSVKKREIVDGNVLDWQPPAGLKEILSEEWDLMEAKHKRRVSKVAS
jgi:hypothetical protein